MEKKCPLNRETICNDTCAWYLGVTDKGQCVALSLRYSLEQIRMTLQDISKKNN